MFGAAAALAVLRAPTTALAEDDSNHLQGTWSETISSPGAADFQNLLTFDPGGGLVGIASIDSAPGFKSSATQGAWTHSGGRTYKWHGLAFSFDDTGNLNGIYDIRETLTLNHTGTAYSGKGTFEIKPAGSNPLTVPLTGYTVSAVRIMP